MRFTYVIENDRPLGDVLKNDEGENKIKRLVGEEREIRAAGFVEGDIGRILQAFARLANHLAGNVNGVHMPEAARKMLAHAPKSATNLEHRHRLGITIAGDSLQVGDDALPDV